MRLGIRRRLLFNIDSAAGWDRDAVGLDTVSYGCKSFVMDGQLLQWEPEIDNQHCLQ